MKQTFEGREMDGLSLLFLQFLFVFFVFFLVFLRLLVGRALILR